MGVGVLGGGGGKMMDLEFVASVYRATSRWDLHTKAHSLEWVICLIMTLPFAGALLNVIYLRSESLQFYLSVLIKGCPFSRETCLQNSLVLFWLAALSMKAVRFIFLREFLKDNKMVDLKYSKTSDS